MGECGEGLVTRGTPSVPTNVFPLELVCGVELGPRGGVRSEEEAEGGLGVRRVTCRLWTTEGSGR